MTGLNPAATPEPLPEAAFDPWNFRPDVAVEIHGAKLGGYQVEAVDGNVGKVTDYRFDPGDSFLVVKTGRLFGGEALVPAGTVNHIDHTDHRIYLDRTRDQVKQAPEVPAEAYGDRARRQPVADYFQGLTHTG